MQSSGLPGNEHDRIREILTQLEEHSQSTVRIREKLFEKFLNIVIPHIQAEEFAFHSFLGRRSEFTDELYLLLEEHQLFYNFITEMKTIPKIHERWGAKVRVLKEMLERHMDFEENEFLMVITESLAEEQISRFQFLFRENKDDSSKNLPA